MLFRSLFIKIANTAAPKIEIISKSSVLITSDIPRCDFGCFCFIFSYVLNGLANSAKYVPLDVNIEIT